MKHLLTFGLIILFSLPMLTFAAGVVPCGGTGEPACQACHFVQLGQNLLTWFIGVMASVIALVFAWGGMKMVMSGGSGEGISEARGMMTNSIIGFLILLSAYLIVDTVLKTFVDGSKLGTWNKIECVMQPAYIPWAENTGRPVVGGGTASVLSASDIASRFSSTATYRNQLCGDAQVLSMGNQCDSLQALMGIESNGDPNAVSPVGAVGLMQIMPGTARTLDPRLAGLSDAEVVAKLKEPFYNMQLGTMLYADLLARNGGDLSRTYAAYNGGQGANAASANCREQLRWQCEWDDNAHTVPNIGYAETRNYVRNVNAVRCSIPGAIGC